MTAAIVILGIALIISLAFNMGFLGGGSKPAPSAGATANTSPRPERRDDDAATRLAKAEGELEKKKKELEEVKKAQSELKDELKNTKKKLHGQKEEAKAGDDLVKARAEVERAASLQLETTRSELAAALADVQRLKAEAENRGRKPKAERTEERAAAPAPAAAPEEKKEVVITRVIRELSEAEKEKMNRLEQEARSDKKKAIEAAAELRNVKARVEREKREAKRIYEEGRLARDKFRAVETRLNRTLLENDMVKRALVDLEKKTGQHAERFTPNAEELAASDAKVSERHAAEDRASEEAHKKLEAAEAAQLEAAAAAAAAAQATPAPEAAVAAAPAEAPVAPTA